MSPLIRLPLVVIALMTMVGAGCGDERRRPNERTVLVQVSPEGEPLGDGGFELPPPPEGGGDILVLSGEVDRVVNVGGEIELGVLLFNDEGDPLADELIYFEISEPEITESVLSAGRISTDETGYGHVIFQAGLTIETLTIKARGRQTREVEFIVDVVELPTGNLEVALEYQGPIELGATEVYLVERPAWCDDPAYLVPPENIIQSRNLDSPGAVARFDNLLSGTPASVVVRARTQEGRILAGGGCAGDVEVPELDTLTVRVPVFLLPLEISGTYTVDNTYDFTNAVPGTLGNVIRSLVRFFGVPGEPREVATVIFDVLEQLAREAAGIIGGVAVELVRGWVEDDLNQIINSYIDYDAPQWIRDFFQIGSDLLQVVARMEVISRVRLGKVRSDGTFEGSQSWIGLAFRWTLPCQDDPDPDCGRHTFTMDEVAGGLEGVDLVFGQFTGRVFSYDRLRIDEHTLDLQYGRLILFVLNNLILPRVADGADNITDALLNLADCPAFARRITNGRDHLTLGGIEIASRRSIEGWCTTVMSVTGDGARAILGRLRVDTRLTLDGEVRLIERNNNLIVDGLSGGEWRGVIRTSEEAGPPFDGTFSGSRDTRVP